MTAKEKIAGLLMHIAAMAKFGKQDNEPGTYEEDKLLYEVAVLGVEMGNKLFDHVTANRTLQGGDQDTVTE